MSKLSFKELISVGFMVFSIFFGAGNLIFPPLLAQDAGTNFLVAMGGFFVTGIGLPLLGLIALVSVGGKYEALVSERLHPWFLVITFSLLYLVIGPFFAMPRTGAVSFEIGIRPFLAIDDLRMGQFIYTAVFFAVTYFFAANPSRLVDRVGKILCPLLLFFLCILFARTFYEPIGTILEPINEYVENPFSTGFVSGYQTMDMLASLAIGGLAITAVKEKGITEPGAIRTVCIKACIVAIVLMAMVYGSLAYLGATCPSVLGYSANGGVILSSATYVFFGDTGKIILAVIIGFACLTTSIGISAASAGYFQYVLGGRVGYKPILAVSVFFTFLAANLGLTELIRISIPFLVALYPIFIVLVLLSLFDRFTGKCKYIYWWSIGLTIPISLLDGLQTAGIGLDGLQELLKAWLPLYGINMGWLLPALVGIPLGLLHGYLKKQH